MTSALRAAPEPSDQWSAWRAALKGEPPELVVGRAESGFYRQRNREGSLIGLAIWREQDRLYLKYGILPTRIVVDEAEFCERTFAWCWKDPVTREQYGSWALSLQDTGTGRWHDDAPAPALDRSNLPQDPFDALKMELEAELVELKRAALEPVTEPEAATRMANWRIRFRQARDRLEVLRKAEKKPHDDAAKEIQRRFLPVMDLAESAEGIIRELLARYADLERRKAKADRDMVVAGRAAAGIENPEADLPDRKITVPTVGRVVSEVTVWSAVIEDFPAALVALMDHPDVRAAVQAIATSSARSQAKLPITGIRYVSQKVMR